ncbi:MAG: nonstructural protein [Microvirus sp.]|nr:MAG: nonstructural protein [Microvirus sp.]
MITNVYSVFDIKAASYAQPFFSQSHATAIRAFSGAVNDPGTMLNRHPEDFTLNHIGEFDDQTGEVIPSTMFVLGTAAAFKTTKE